MADLDLTAAVDAMVTQHFKDQGIGDASVIPEQARRLVGETLRQQMEPAVPLIVKQVSVQTLRAAAVAIQEPHGALAAEWLDGRAELIDAGHA